MWCQCCNLEQVLLFLPNNSECQILQERNLQSPGNKSAEELNCSTFTTVDYLPLIKSVLSKSPPSMAQYIGTHKNIYKPPAYPPSWHHFLNWFVTSGFKGKLYNKLSYTGVTEIKLSIYMKTTIFIGQIIRRNGENNSWFTLKAEASPSKPIWRDQIPKLGKVR